jgi:hypothetical protein
MLSQRHLATYAHLVVTVLRTSGPTPLVDVLCMLRGWRLTENEAEDVLVHALGHRSLETDGNAIRAGRAATTSHAISAR